MSRERACTQPPSADRSGEFYQYHYVLAYDGTAVRLEQVAGDYRPQVNQYFQIAENPQDQTQLTYWVIVKVFSAWEEARVQAFITLIGIEAAENLFRVELPEEVKDLSPEKN